jgi:hypothetical protein
MSAWASTSQSINAIAGRATRLAALGVLLGMVAIRPAAVSAQGIPTIPDPVPVELDAASTAYLVLDLTEATCGPQPACVASVPAVAGLLERARAAGVFIVYSMGSTPGPVLPGLEPEEGDSIVASRANKFFGTDLDDILQARGIRTVVVVGTAANGAPMYTTFEANIRGYTAVVAEDGLSAGGDPFALVVARWQILNQPGPSNPTNEPLREGRATLSRTDLITFR